MKWYTSRNLYQRRIIPMSELFSTLNDSDADAELSRMITRIGEGLRTQKGSIACAESCTGGGVAFALTAVPGSSDWFNQSFVTYSNHAKQQLLGVKEQTLTEYGAVSSQCVQQMAEGTRLRSQATVGISTSGIAGPGGGSTAKPVGTVWFGLAMDNDTITVCQQFKGGRAAVRQAAVRFAIELLHNRLVEKVS